MKNLILFFATVFLHVAVVAQPNVGAKAPDFSLPDANANSVSLSSFKGKVVLLDFWASWCGPCRSSNKKLVPVYNKYQSKGFEVLGVSVDDRKGAWLNAVRQDKTKWMQLIDPDATRGSKLMQVWNVRYIPSTFLLDKQGVVVAVNPGKDELEKWLEKLL